jgi:hypothetical protein
MALTVAVIRLGLVFPMIPARWHLEMRCVFGDFNVSYWAVRKISSYARQEFSFNAGTVRVSC